MQHEHDGENSDSMHQQPHGPTLMLKHMFVISLYPLLAIRFYRMKLNYKIKCEVFIYILDMSRNILHNEVMRESMFFCFYLKRKSGC